MVLTSKILILLMSAATFVSSSYSPIEEGYREKIYIESIEGFPNPASNITHIDTPGGAQMRYKEPALSGFCNIPGIKSYSGYISMNASVNMYFWFSTTATDCADKPITLWMNGGPGADSLPFLMGVGPCKLKREHGWVTGTEPTKYDITQHSNLLFLSQPLGVGFSYSDRRNTTTGSFPYIPPKDKDDTTRLAAEASWEIVQTLMKVLPQLDGQLKSKTFNIWGVSYEGHYGPIFMDHFAEQNKKIADRSIQGIPLDLDVLGIDSGCVSSIEEYETMPYYANATQVGKQDVIHKMLDAYNRPEGCKSQLQRCHDKNGTMELKQRRQTCAAAGKYCEFNVYRPFWMENGLNPYNVSIPSDPVLRIDSDSGDRDEDSYGSPGPAATIEFLNRPEVQDALGVSINYTFFTHKVFHWFEQTGDIQSAEPKAAIERLLNAGVRVAFIQGDRDYRCNWLAIQRLITRLDLNCYSDHFSPSSLDMTKAQNFTVANSTRPSYGETVEYGKLSFTLVRGAGHCVDEFEREVAFEHFGRAVGHLPVADGRVEGRGSDGEWFERNRGGNCSG